MAQGENIGSTYTKVLNLSPENTRINVKFFDNSLFCIKLQQYISQVYHIKCLIQFARPEVILTLIGVKEEVKAARDGLKNLFQSVRTKIYNPETEDQRSKVLYWSRKIFSDAAVSVIQQIMNNEKLFTVWDKTELFTGYYQVMYFTSEPFAGSEENINRILNREIVYLEAMKMPDVKTKKFIEEMEQFIATQKQPELMIIHCKYPYQMEIKVSLFGRKIWVKTVKKQLQSLVNKHTLQVFEIQMTPIEYNFLVDNCLQKIKEIESDYQEDNVQLRMRLKEFSAPQYLIQKIKAQINELISEIAICVIQKIGDVSPLTDEQIDQLNQIGRRHYCRIVGIESITEMQAHSIPKAVAKTTSTSKLIIEQSNSFCSSLSMRRVSLSHGSIEIHTRGYSMALTDVHVISTDAGAVEARIESVHENGFFQTTSGRQMIFHRWVLPTTEADSSNNKLKRSIEKFISSVGQTIAVNCPDAQTIVFLANEWGNFNGGEQFIMDMKRELETRRSSWRVLFVFDDEQSVLCKDMLQTIVRLQTDNDGFIQFLSSVLTIKVTLTTSKGNNLIKCENEIHRYIQQNISFTETIENASDLTAWDQPMINVFHKYCTEKSVLPKMNLITSQLELTGSTADMKKAKQKYTLMSEILKVKSSIRAPPPVAPRLSTAGKTRPDTAYNIALGYCSSDEMIGSRLANSLIAEGYSLCQSSPGVFLSQPQIQRSDLMLIYFSENYTKDARCMTDINYAKSIGKKIISIAVKKKEEDAWLSSVTNDQLFYRLFETEMEIEFDDDFDLEYEQLLILLLRHTKPGVTGQVYPQAPAIPETISDTNNEQSIFGRTSINLQKVTTEQRQEREKAYKLQCNKRIQNEKIASDDLNILVGDLILVVEDLECILRGENPDNNISPDDRWKYSLNWITDETSTGHSKVYAKDLLHCIQRWLNRSPNVIKKNIAPFTPTGDINDAQLTLYQPIEFDWWKDDYKPLENLPVKEYFSTIPFNTEFPFTNEQAHDYAELLIRFERTNVFDATIEGNDAVWDTVSIGEVGDDGDDEEIDDKWKTPEQIRKVQELDNLNRKWKRKAWATEAFMKQKRQNILEFQQLCQRFSNN